MQLTKKQTQCHLVYQRIVRGGGSANKTTVEQLTDIRVLAAMKSGILRQTARWLYAHAVLVHRIV